MEVREFAEKVLFSRSLKEKLAPAGPLTDESPGTALVAPDQPGRPGSLEFTTGQFKFSFPSTAHLESEETRGHLLHFFANHELLATELMALVLLKFPDAPKEFRAGVLRTLKEEQDHTRMYLGRLKQLGVGFGEHPVNGFFWRMIADMATPMDYVSRLSLTFEQANLDYSRFFGSQFATIGDELSEKLMRRIYEDEIGHVGYGLEWFRKWKDPQQSDWEAFENHLELPHSPNRAKAVPFNREGRQLAGLDEEFIDELFVYSKSKGRTPDVYLFNPFAESFMGRGSGFAPNKQQAALANDLENLPQFLCRKDDVVLVNHRPNTRFLAGLQEAGFELPQFERLGEAGVSETSELRSRKLGALKPWAWSSDSLSLLRPLSHQAAANGRPIDDQWIHEIRPFYSKTWGADRLIDLLKASAEEDWLCSRRHVGRLASSVSEAESLIKAIRAAGHRRVVAKMLFGVAGSNMQRLWEPELTASQRKWLERTIAAEGGVLIEPWLDRVLDFSFQFHQTDGKLRPVGMVRMVNDQRGQYQASEHYPKLGTGLSGELQALLNGPRGGRLKQLQESLRNLLEPNLAQAGFQGALGVDAFAYRHEGRLLIKPITEINARYTMGRLMLELMRNAASGRCGRMELMGPAALKRTGLSSFAELAEKLAEEEPIRLAGHPKPQIQSGAICLNDPTTAKGCVAVFRVGSQGHPNA